MYRSLCALLCAAVFARADNLFTVPESFTNLTVPSNAPVLVQWRCDDCGSKETDLTLFQIDKEDGQNSTWKVKTLLGTLQSHGSRFTRPSCANWMFALRKGERCHDIQLAAGASGRLARGE
jgi:hypothetical protein